MKPELIQACLDWWVARLNLIPELKDKVVLGFSVEDMMQQLSAATGARIGIVYEGIVPVQTPNKDSHVVSISASIGVGLCLIADGKLPGQERGVIPAVRILDKIRKSGFDQRSPTGHFWKMLAELPASEKNGVQVWLQRWSSPIQLS